ncbi:hypothetical protein TVAG_087490 [Trichomonas vaginalis G3]|uniref:Uncharacterized protein n=1 Tax=Trichomonas vaginalis (strain ATCC PRA-98 / G3) TaxID=412133 RepID=A2FDS5_TRIV3|nr:hypothetical protein TVAGG3_0371330 [Trichomonas vaginalis G3]EAX96924.1 hypothetical protein TVAG_087490 [Trichomonas vaginalis G3]KAI5532629.1 hypothetical protein TVAGG3_0371330 [Trichomonas vaginalis G3]|eukprot:XP_001309854.1 hypothetical protein [Trichomonas vaginalis G3]
MQGCGKFDKLSRSQLINDLSDTQWVSLKRERRNYWKSVYLNNGSYSKSDYCWDNRTQIDEQEQLSQSVLALSSTKNKLNVLLPILNEISVKGFDFFSFRASSMMKRLTDFIVRSFETLNDEEKKIAIKILNILTNDQNNRQLLPLQVIELAVQHFGSFPEDSLSILKNLDEILLKSPKFDCSCPNEILNQIDDDNLIIKLLCLCRNLISYISVDRALALAETSPSLLVELTRKVKNSCFDSNLRRFVLNLIKKGQIEIGCAALCNIFDECPDFADDLSSEKELISILTKQTTKSGTIATIALSFLDKSNHTIDCLQKCYAKEVDPKMRSLIRERIVSLEKQAI